MDSDGPLTSNIHTHIWHIVVVDPKIIRSVTQKPWHDPNREFCDPLHPVFLKHQVRLSNSQTAECLNAMLSYKLVNV